MERTIAFGPLTIAYDARVLEPRPWTAIQSEWARELLAEAPPGPVLELCTGAGHIGLLAVAGTSRTLVAVDANPAACAWARSNAAANGLADRLEVREGLLEEEVRPDEVFALVIADPPWVPRAEVGRFPEDPLLAIDGGTTGLDVAQACLAVAARSVVPGFSVLLQLGYDDQADALAPAAAARGLAERERRHGERGLVVRYDRLGPASA